MLIKIGENEAYVPRVSGDKESGLRLLSLDGTERRVDVGDRHGWLISEPDGKLIFRHSDGVSLVDPINDFEISELSKYNGTFSDVRWSSCFSYLFVDSVNRQFREFELDLEALQLMDPGYSNPSGSALIPGGCEVVVTISRNQHIAIVNADTNDYRLVELSGRYGSSSPVVKDGQIWVVNYDVLCRIDVETLSVAHSPLLQPEIFHKAVGRKGSAFVGVPYKSIALNGWLVPRPYSSDILLVDPATLEPTGHITCGGKPFSLVEFEDGDLLIIDHPFDAFQTANIRDLKAL